MAPVLAAAMAKASTQAGIGKKGASAQPIAVGRAVIDNLRRNNNVNIVPPVVHFVVFRRNPKAENRTTYGTIVPRGVRFSA